MEYEKTADGRYYVYLMPEDGRRDGVHNPLADTLVESLQDQIAMLKAELADRKEEARRKDHLLAAALERIPAIEPPEPPGAPETPDEEPVRVEDQDRGKEAQEEGAERWSWWRRVFG